MKKTFLILCCAFSIFIFQFSIYKCVAQVDTVQTKKHSPKTASCLALIPGAGQIYNKKYWKLPIVYGGLGATGYLIYHYQGETAKYKKEYITRLNKDSVNFSTDPDIASLSDASIQHNRDTYRRNMEICIGVCAIVYALSILDACVDAHLFYYDVSDNLSMAIRPKLNYHPVSGKAAPCLALIIRF